MVLGEEQHQQPRRHPHQQQQQHANGNNNSSDWDREEALDNVQFRSSRRYPDNHHHAEVVAESRYKQQPQQQSEQQQKRGILSDTRPYASTNLIHQIGQDHVDSRPMVTVEQPQQRQQQQQQQQQRTMRYFGDTDLESQPSRGGGYSSRYQPKAKVTRSASTAAGMGAVRR